MDTSVTIIKQAKGTNVYSAMRKACNTLCGGQDALDGINDIRVAVPRLMHADEDMYWVAEINLDPHDDSYHKDVQFRVYDDCVITLDEIRVVG